MLTRLKLSILASSLLVLASCGGSDSEVTLSEQEVQQLNEQAELYASEDVETLKTNVEAMKVASGLFQVNCASCHGSDAVGRRTIPNLVTGTFDYGDSIDAISETIRKGRHSEMPSLGKSLGEADLGMIALYVKSFSTGAPKEEQSKRAVELYDEMCKTCHGESGQPNLVVGIPDLSDDFWQHGDSATNIRLTVMRGTDSQCPAQEETLGSGAINLLTAYVMQLRDAS